MTMPAYPLAQVLQVKERHVTEAEKVVQEKQRALEKEKEILAQKEAEREKVRDHHKAKLAQMRHAMDTETTSTEIQQMKAYLKVVQERLVTEDKKVKDQQQQVDNAQKNLDNAKEDLRLKRQEVDKLKSHRTDWLKEVRKEIEIKEGREQDEIGSIIFTSHHTRRKT